MGRVERKGKGNVRGNGRYCDGDIVVLEDVYLTMQNI
jgi:hypothetical protein